ncbi:helix-turn-helix domain-containing protein [Micromonospora sp. CA-259024]|uniref:helix-turn-helix domain-containing protein n=1 Tax=Micromonospora sp. CA-259024 TaxID=3239965 RepID=UPI003D929808
MHVVTGNREVLVLEILGVSAQEEMILEALVRRNLATVTELADDCRLTEQAVRRIAQALTRRGLANRLPGRPTRYTAVPPDNGIEALILDHEGAIRDVRTRMNQLMEMFRAGTRFTNPADLIEVVTGRDEVYARWEQLQRGARAEVCTFDRPPYAMADPFLTPNDLEREILAKGTTYRAVYDSTAMELPGWLDHVTASVRAGERARVSHRLPMKLAISDGRLAIIPLLRSGDHEVAATYVIHPSPILDALIAFFESVWKRSQPVRLNVHPGSLTPDDLSGDDARMLALLAAGMTDGAAGRVLGWSERTVQRRVASLMDRLGVQTRLQMGIAVSRRDWV